MIYHHKIYRKEKSHFWWLNQVLGFNLMITHRFLPKTAHQKKNRISKLIFDCGTGPYFFHLKKVNTPLL